MLIPTSQTSNSQAYVNYSVNSSFESLANLVKKKQKPSARLKLAKQIHDVYFYFAYQFMMWFQVSYERQSGRQKLWCFALQTQDWSHLEILI